MNEREIDSCGFGLLVHVNNKKSAQLIKQALTGLSRLSHRGAVDEDTISGDGCGIMLQLDRGFFSAIAKKERLPVTPSFALGMCFLNPEDTLGNKDVLEQALKTQGFSIAGWRKVPLNLNCVNRSRPIPFIEQIFINCMEHWSIPEIERRLFIAKLAAQTTLQHDEHFTICSLSSQTIVYKALVLTQNLPLFYPDLANKQMKSAVALFHQRFSTNTSPSWKLAQPFALLAHNGEINTIQGNRHYAKQISPQLIAQHYPELNHLNSLINTQGSDSLSMDNLLESLVYAGLPTPEALRLMIPQAWENNMEITSQEQAYYQYHALHLPPWEGPAGIVFFDGRYAGCILDRNGFRPARILGKEQWIGIGSEIGLFDFADETITTLSRMKPGELFVIDLHNQCILNSQSYMKSLFEAHPYEQWLVLTALYLEEQETSALITKHHPVPIAAYNHFDVSLEEQEQNLRIMAEQGVEPTFSMGDDTPLAALSSQPRQLFDFFRQQFAQVTNPPVDSLREKSVISAQTYLGNKTLPTKKKFGYARQIKLPSPLLTYSQRQRLSELPEKEYTLHSISLTYSPNTTVHNALQHLTDTIIIPEDDKHHIITLTDEYSQHACLIHPMLALGALHHELIKRNQRQRTSLIVSSGWIRDAHHLAMLVTCGADAIYPWLAYKLIIDISQQSRSPPLEGLAHYRQAMNKGLLKICSKMGVCTINSYRGAQLFHVIGLHGDIIKHCFSQCAHWLEHYDWAALDAHQKEAFYYNIDDTRIEPRPGGLYKYAPQGEYHDYNPDVVTSLLKAVGENDARYYQQFKDLINSRKPAMVRDFLQIRVSDSPLNLTQVESAETIIKRFDTAAMSLGALAPEAHEALAIAMNRLGGRSNSGEGGEARHRHGQLTRSKIKQIASGRFGVTAEYLINAEVIQIKIAQGAKPGEGGQLPGNKVNQLIAELRYCSPGVTPISPPPHHDIYSIEDLAQLIFDLKQINPNALISVKLVAAPGIGTIAAGVVKAYADMITISGYDGGTGASPLSAIRYTGCPWELGLSDAQNVLLKNKLRHRVTLQVDGGLKTGLDVVKAALLGAESFGFGTAPMITLGCKYLRICHLNNCATGIATQDERLREGFYKGEPERVMRYFQWVAEEVRELLALMGYQSLQDIIGRVDLLDLVPQVEPWNHAGFMPFINHALPDEAYRKTLYLQQANPSFDKGLLASQILKDVMPAIQQQVSYSGRYLIANHNRSIGANLAGAIAARYGNNGFKAELKLLFYGIAGQSFAAWLIEGLAFYLEGAANDYVAKGMHGGEVIITPSPKLLINPRQTTLAGNTCLYGATGGLCCINGLAGERFAVRNSGAKAVILGVGNHGCEYMTGGSVLILSTPGTNFAAGMTGGMAFVFDDQKCLPTRCNLESVSLYPLNHSDLGLYQQYFTQLLDLFIAKTQSKPAQQLKLKRHNLWKHCYLVLPNSVSPVSKGPL